MIVRNFTFQLFVILCAYYINLSQCSTSDDEEVVVETVYDDDTYETPTPLDKQTVYLAETFDDQAAKSRWIKSENKASKDDDKDKKEVDGKKVYGALWEFEESVRWPSLGDKGLVFKTQSEYGAIGRMFDRPFHFINKPLVVQYDVTHQEGQICGGSYLKLLTDMKDLKKLDDKTPYAIMFGPDKCGGDVKIHFIFKHQNPLTGKIEEKHVVQPSNTKLASNLYADQNPHHVQLILNPDNTFIIKVDGTEYKSGNLLEDFQPPVNPPAEIDDPEDKKPEDWDEKEKIPDPTAEKPDDWDEDEPAEIVDEDVTIPDDWLVDVEPLIPDPSATKPADWDSEMDGEWEAPLIENPLCEKVSGCGPWKAPLKPNPKFKGKWRAPLIDNPNYQGKWKPRKIKNPDYFEDTQPFRMPSINAVAFELWSVSKGMHFDNILITDNVTVADHWLEITYMKKIQKIENKTNTFWGRMMKKMNYKPYYWLLYGIYCAIPVCFYIWYLLRCYKEASFIQKIAIWTNNYPLLWVVWILGLGSIVVLILYFCCRSSPKVKDKEERDTANLAANRKKTDEPTEDVVSNTNNEEDEENVNEVAEPEVDREKDSGSDSEDVEEEEEKKKDDREEEDTEEGQTVKSGGGDGARKRKVRKE